MKRSAITSGRRWNWLQALLGSSAHSSLAEATGLDRQRAVRRGRWLEYVTIGYNSLEGLIAIVAGLIAGSIALVGFGVDSLIEVTSGAALLWRLHADVDESRRERVEALTLRIVGVCFLVLAVYVLYDSVTALWQREPP